MTITITDPTLIEQLRAAPTTVELCGPDGRFLVRLNVPKVGLVPPGFQSPFTDEEIAEFSKNRVGRPLADILRDLEARG